ncbi:RCC1 domain-containing protein rug3, mitochondrial [Sarracenia purpurea var. burkii]
MEANIGHAYNQIVDWAVVLYFLFYGLLCTISAIMYCELYTWGRDEGDGRLGLGPGRGPNEAGGLSIPSKVKSLPVPVAAVSCGGFFTMALTKEGQLWNWGANSNYELGRGDTVGGWKPKPIPSIESVRVIQIASGGYHSLALTDEGKVLSWGHGGCGQLGHSSTQNQKIPVPVEGLADERVIHIACGGSSSAAITDEGKLYMWGNAKDSQLGIPGLPEVQSDPIEVKFLMEDDGLGLHHVLCVALGASHAVCLVLRSGCQRV